MLINQGENRSNKNYDCRQYVIFLDIICAFIVHTFLLSPPPMFFRETRYCIIYFLYSSSAVIWTKQPDACFFISYYVVYGWPCPLLQYVIQVLRWQKIQNSVCFYLPYSFLYSSVRNYKHNYMVIMPIIVILFFDDVVYEWPLPSTSVSRMVFRRWLPPVLVLWVPLSVHTKAFSSSSVSR